MCANPRLKSETVVDDVSDDVVERGGFGRSAAEAKLRPVVALQGRRDVARRDARVEPSKEVGIHLNRSCIIPRVIDSWHGIYVHHIAL